jgi:hypothetical protein
MRTLLAVASLMMLVGAGFGCGDDTTAATADMTLGPDMSAIPHDMTTLTCAQILACVQGCAGNTTCDATCVSEGSTNGKALIGAFTTCLAETCGPGDGGNDSCTSLTDTSTACANCLNSTGTNAALGGGAPCSTEFAACAAG